MHENPNIPILAEETTAEFLKFMDKWDKTSDIPEEFLWGKGPDAISSIGTGVAWKNNFFEFMRDTKTKEIIEVLNDLRKNNPQSYKLIRPIHEVGLLDYVEKYQFSNGNRPQICVRRFLNMMFPDLFTTIDDEAQLRNTAQKLGHTSFKTVNFVYLQYDVREKINGSINSLQLPITGRFSESALAYWIVR